MQQPKVSVVTRYNQNIIQQTVEFKDLDIQGSIWNNVMNLQDRGIRDALIALGWTPPPAPSLSLTRQAADAIEDSMRQQWQLGAYDNGEHGCPKCGRSRLCICPNGKHRCEKCNWVPEDNSYAPVD